MSGRATPVDRSLDAGLIDDVRRFGIDIAEEIATRFSRMVAPLAAGTGGAAAGKGGRGDMTDEVAAATAATLRLLDGLAAMAGEIATGGRNGDDPRRAVVVEVTPPAWSGSSVLWIHNTTQETTPEVTFVSGDLVASNGGHLPASSVGFTPATATTMDRGSSRPVTVTVTVPPSTEPGIYHGLVVATGIDTEPLHLRIEVGDTEGDR